MSTLKELGKRTDTDTYRFVNTVPWRDGADALNVNWCALTTTAADGKVVYHNAFATNRTIDAGNVAEIVRAGRARWKVRHPDLAPWRYGSPRVNIRSAHLRGKKVRDTGGKIGYNVRHGRYPSSQRYRWAAATADMPR